MILPPNRREGEKESPGVLAGGVEGGKGVAGALGNAVANWKAFSDLPPPRELRALLE